MTPGTKLGPYEILSSLGAGGMGEVYRARDTRLERIVAIKILPERFSDRSELRERFEREARTIASLNHPHICTLYDIGHQDGTDYLVMECLEGETLAEKLAKGPLPLDQVLRYAIEISDALDKAHRKGVTHRDLKPGNIMLTKSGAKLLDFGLAKLRREASPAAAVSQLPTADQPITAQGMIVGTLQYMAPEQLEGKEVDARTDIFAFGAVVYEMATGKRAFAGKSQASIMAKILETDPTPISSLQPMTPPALDRLVKKCLAKDPDDRWQTAGDLHDELEWIAGSGSQAAASPSAVARSVSTDWRQVTLWSLASVIVAAVVGLAVWNLKPSPAKPVTRFTITLPPGQHLAGLSNPTLALSPDGSELAYVAATQSNVQQIYLRAMNSTEARAISGTEEAMNPFFSPDGHWLGFFADGKLKKISVNGGVAQTLTDVGQPLGATWGSQGTIIFSTPGSALQQVADAGGAARPLTRLEGGEFVHWWPEFMPSGDAVLFLAQFPPTIAVQLIGAGERRNLIQGQAGIMPRYAPSGHLIYAQGDTLMAVPVDLKHLEVKGAAVPVVQGVLDAQYSTSSTGTLAYVPGGVEAAQRRFVWVSRNGTEQPLAAPARNYGYPKLSPDGRAIAVGVTDNEGAEQLGLYDLTRETLSQFTFAGSFNGYPVWTPDAKRIAFLSNKEGSFHVFWQLADGSGSLERLTNGTSELPFSFSPDGQQLAFVEVPGSAPPQIWVLGLRDHKGQRFLQTRAVEDAPQFSPDGRWLAYASEESGRREIYVQPYPGPGRKWQISTDGGTEPIWNRNGRELFYRNGDKMMAVEINGQASFAAGKPRQLFEGHYLLNDIGYAASNYDVSPDGQRFLMLKPIGQEQAAPTQINVVLNWTEELKRLVPTGK
jgi:eukaryotic-like serine/threonine-protein kinase